MRVCSVCDEVITDPHVHNVWRYYHPFQIEQRPVSGLSLEPLTFAVLIYCIWVDVGMDFIYYRTSRYPSVGLS